LKDNDLKRTPDVRSKSAQRTKLEYITLREAGAMVMNPDNPEAAYLELDEAVVKTARIFFVSRRTSRICAVLALASAAISAFTGAAHGATTLTIGFAIMSAASAIFAGLTHEVTLRKTFIGGLVVPRQPEPVSDLMNRLARGEFTAHWGEHNQVMVNIEDIRTVVGDRKREALSPVQAVQGANAAQDTIRDLSLDISLSEMDHGAQTVEPATIEELNQAPGSAHMRINAAYAFIFGDGDPLEGAALLRQFERRSNAIIRQPDSQYVLVGDVRKFLKDKQIPGVETSAWDGTR